IDRTQAHIDDVRPVTAKNALVIAPTIVNFDVSVQVSLDGLTLADATTQIIASLQDDDSRREPAVPFIRSQSGTLISLIPGITDREFIAPAANIVPVVNEEKVEWLRLGNVEVGLL
ncbi:phage tail protein, partial [Escherichia coli]|nr:phage tail protein [Escherichia coli]